MKRKYLSKFISIFVVTALIISCSTVIYAQGTDYKSSGIENGNKNCNDAMRNYIKELCPDKDSYDGVVLSLLGYSGTLYYMSTEAVKEEDCEEIIGDLTYSASITATPYPLGLYVVDESDYKVYTLKDYCEKYTDRDLYELADQVAQDGIHKVAKNGAPITTTPNAGVTTPIDPGTPTTDDCARAVELLREKYDTPWININLVDMGALGEGELYYNDTKYVQFLDYDLVYDNYKFDVYSQQSPTDLGLYYICNDKAYSFDEAYKEKLFNMEDAANLIFAKDMKYTFKLSKIEETSSTIQTPTETSTEPITNTIEKPTTAPTEVKVNKITVTPENAVLNVGKTKTLKATVAPGNATNKGVKWSSSNSKVAKVNQKGKVIGVKKGTATITATALDGSGVKASCKITVKQPVNKITLNIKSKTIRVGKKIKIMATAKPGTANDKSIKWTVSNKKVATLAKAKTASGKYNTITAKKAGKVTITAKPAQGGKISVSCKITVK